MEATYNIIELLTWVVIVVMIFAAVVFFQWKWTKICAENVLVLIKKADGHGNYQLAPQVGGSVGLKNKDSNTVRMWPINELATIDVPYPGVGFVPAFMQKTIRMVIVDEQDWEPLTNRSPHRPRVMSPDVVSEIEYIMEDIKDENVIRQFKELLDGVSTGPSRELIASPALLGNTVMERVSEVAITVVKDVMDPITNIIKRLNDLVTPKMFYVGIGAVLVAIAASTYFSYSLTANTTGLAEQIATIQQSLGLVPGASIPLTVPVP